MERLTVNTFLVTATTLIMFTIIWEALFPLSFSSAGISGGTFLPNSLLQFALFTYISCKLHYGMGFENRLRPCVPVANNMNIHDSPMTILGFPIVQSSSLQSEIVLPVDQQVCKISL